VTGPTVRRLVVVRHGRTAWNAEQRFQGQADPPLDATGEAQALAVAAEVAPLEPVVVLSSDLRRARDTAVPLVAATGAVWVTDQALREVYLGGWEGLDHDQVRARFPDQYADWVAGRPVRRGGGETEAEAGRRAAARMVAELAAWPDGATVAVVAHGLVLKAALGALDADGVIELAGDAPHLGNGRWLALVAQVGAAPAGVARDGAGGAPEGRAHPPRTVS
jgi:broad specificity phosphatase PhoE